MNHPPLLHRPLAQQPDFQHAGQIPPATAGCPLSPCSAVPAPCAQQFPNSNAVWQSLVEIETQAERLDRALRRTWITVGTVILPGLGSLLYALAARAS